jgi:predicted metal-binding protein
MSLRKPSLDAAEQPWSTALVLVCSECDGGHGLDLAQRLKDEMKQAGHKKDVRVARVRCLGICPKRGVAVTVTGGARTACSYVVTGRDRDAVADLAAVILPG